MWFSGGPATGTFKHQTCCMATGAPKTFQSFPGGSQVSKDIRGHIFNSPNWGLSRGNCDHTTWPTYPQTSHLTSVIRELEVGESHNACVSVYNTTYTCNAHMHMCTVMHACTHTDSSARSSWAGEDLKLCQERNTMKRNNPHRCARAGGQGHAQTGFPITYLKPWLLPKQRNGASDLDKRGRAIIHVNRLHRRETEGERYSSMKANVPGPGNRIWLLRPDTSQRESGRGLGRPLPLTLPGPLPALKASPAHGPAGRPQPPRTDGSSHNLIHLPRKAPQSPPHQLQEQKQMGSGT